MKTLVTLVALTALLTSCGSYSIRKYSRRNYKISEHMNVPSHMIKRKK